MEIPNSKIEHEPVPKDISSEFLNMDILDFMDFLSTQENEPSLSITIDWIDASTARRLKAFIDMGRGGQTRSATIRATEEQYNQALNVFASGVTWERV